MQHIVYCIDWTWLWLVVSTIVNSLQTGLLTSELVWYCRYSWTNSYCNEWLLVLMSRDVNDPISWHPGCDVISGDIQRCWQSELQFWSVKFTGRIVFCEVLRICKLKSIYTVDKLYQWTVRLLLEVYFIIGCCEYELCSKIFRPFITDQEYTLNFCRLISSLTLGKVSEGLWSWFISSNCS